MIIVAMEEMKKDPRYTEDRDYAMGANQNKFLAQKRTEQKPETDNYQTGLNCRKPL